MQKIRLFRSQVPQPSILRLSSTQYRDRLPLPRPTLRSRTPPFSAERLPHRLQSLPHGVLLTTLPFSAHLITCIHAAGVEISLFRAPAVCVVPPAGYRPVLLRGAPQTPLS
jgi:hypothetical protein